MQETNIFEYYAFGYDYYFLRFESKGIYIHKESDGGSLISRIDDFLNYIDKLNLQVTKVAAEELRQIRNDIESLPPDALVDESLEGKIREAVNKIDTTLDAELKLRSAFIVTPKRYDLSNLLKTPQNLFGTSIFEKLPNLCQFDFQQAARCIAFGLPTSAAFHLMRATEGVLRHYYCSIVKYGRIRLLLWDNMVEHLRKRRDHPPKTLMDNLDNIRVNFRNPTQHPDARFDMDEAQDLLSVSIDAVNRMIKDLATRNK